MHPARKRRIHDRDEGRCADCGDPVPVDGPGVIYDHDIQLWMEGPEDDANVRPLCFTCNKTKTARDTQVRAKVKRLLGVTGKKNPWNKIRSPGFRKDLTQKMDGTIVPRKPRYRGPGDPNR